MCAQVEPGIQHEPLMGVGVWLNDKGWQVEPEGGEKLAAMLLDNSSIKRNKHNAWGNTSLWMCCAGCSATKHQSLSHARKF